MRPFHIHFAHLYLVAALLLLLQPTIGGAKNPNPIFRKGRDHALFFAVSDYKNPKFDRLKNPVTNARAIASVLSSKYGFDTTVVVNPTLRTIANKIEEFRDKFARNVDGRYPENGQLIIYFSGHGMLADYNGYFIPSDGDPYSPITSAFAYKIWRPVISAINCKHILVAIDACYSSSFSPKYGTQADPVFKRPGEYSEEQKIIINHDDNKTRIFFTSDAKEKETPDMSTFATKFLQGLNQNSNSFLTSTQLYSNYIDFAFPKAKAGDFEGDGGGAFLFFLAQTQTDTDSDGIPDTRDECPRLYAKTPSGCPDADEDGIPDPKDNCPYEAGPTSNQGCPTQAADADGDGIPDVGDACPTEKGLARFAGCPDTDSDGIPDKDDNCPRQSGPASNRGCPLAPDTDRDGIPDANDRCPDQSGPASNNGCPLPPPIPTGMVLVQGGTFQMGDVMGDNEETNETVHTVTVSNFLLAKNELTFDEYDAFCKATGRTLPADEGWGRGKRPVINVDWYDAIEYCNWRSTQEGLQAVYSINKNSKDSNNSNTSDTKKWLVTTSRSANGYRLPTEAEWEYAARAGGKKVRFGNGKDIADPKEINFDASSGGKKAYSVVGEYRQKTLPVGSFSPNTLDLFDMSGNVWEWCGDWYGTYPSSASNDPQGATGGSRRVIRGGSWYLDPAGVRVAYCVIFTPDDRDDDLGFRLARAAVAL